MLSTIPESENLEWERTARVAGKEGEAVQAQDSSPFDRLPTELLVQILSALPSRDLFAVSPTNRRIHACAQDILLPRLRELTAEDLRLLLFECFHRFTRTTIHFWHCRYLGSWNNDGRQKQSESRLDEVTSGVNSLDLEKDSDNDMPPPQPAKPIEISSYYSYFEPVSERIASPRKQEEWEPYLNVNLSGGAMDALTFQARLVTLNGRKMRFLSLVDVFEARDMLTKEWLEDASEVGDSVVLDLKGNKSVELSMKVAKPVVAPTSHGEGNSVIPMQDKGGEFCLKFEGLKIRTALLLFVLENNRELPVYA